MEYLLFYNLLLYFLRLVINTYKPITIIITGKVIIKYMENEPNKLVTIAKRSITSRTKFNKFNPNVFDIIFHPKR